MARLFLGLGSNLGNRAALLHRAIEALNERVGAVVSQSAFYETAPWGFASVHPFLNAAVCVETNLAPLAVLDITQQIERELGRIHKSADGHYADRPIDIDLLLFDSLTMRTSRLTLPHPLMAERSFVLRPLAEIAPDALHPVLKKTIGELWEELKK